MANLCYLVVQCKLPCVTHLPTLCSTCGLCGFRHLAQPGVFAGNDSIVAFARRHNLTVVIHQVRYRSVGTVGTHLNGIRTFPLNDCLIFGTGIGIGLVGPK